MLKNNKKITSIGLLIISLFTTSTIDSAIIPVGNKKNSEISVIVNNMSVDNGQLTTDLTFDLSDIKLKGNSEVIVTPMLVNGNNVVSFESFTVAGRNRWYWIKRNNIENGLLVKGWGKERGQIITDGIQGKVMSLQSSIPWQNWMNNATLIVKTEDVGCANCGKDENDYPLAVTSYQSLTYAPADFIYITPVAEAVKMREISARAYIDFPVNRTEIYPEYRRNPQELAKIKRTIDSVRNDKDITVKSLHISGTASPEGSYSNNVRLAKGRTEALKDYVQLFYRFPFGFITTSYEPVDWQGLSDFLNGVLNIRYGNSNNAQRNNELFSNNESSGNYTVGRNKFGTYINPSQNYHQPVEIPQPIVQQNKQPDNTYFSPMLLQEGAYNLPHASEILNIVNSYIEPYQRNQNIKNNYPREYTWLLQNVYPALRHSDYKIEFEIKSYNDVSEILAIMTSQPQKLSLAEFFAAANSVPEGSELYNKAFELAVMMYPEDETANLNAGIASMKRGEMEIASHYLVNAGNTPEANYARAVYSMLNEDYTTARLILGNLVDSSNREVAHAARSVLENMDMVDSSNGFTWKAL